MDIGLLSFIYHATRASANGKYIQKRKSPLPRRRADFYLIDMDVLSFLEAKSKIGGLPCKCHSDELLDELCFHLKHRLYLRKILEKAAVGVRSFFLGSDKHIRDDLFEFIYEHDLCSTPARYCAACLVLRAIPAGYYNNPFAIFRCMLSTYVLQRKSPCPL